MDITNIDVYPFKGKKSNLKAYVNVEFDEEFVVKGLKVLDGKKGLFVSMPASEGKDGEYYDIAFPITKEFRDTLVDFILDAYDDAMDDIKRSKKSSKNSSKKSSRKKSSDDDDEEDD